MSKEKSEDPDPTRVTGAQGSRERSEKYLSLLQPQDPETSSKLWEDLNQDLYRACLRMPALKPQAQRWAQEAVEIIWEKMDEVRDPWRYARGILEIKILEAIRENQKARRHETFDGNEEGERHDHVDHSKEQATETETPEIILQSKLECKEREIFEARVLPKLRNCATSAVKKLPRKSKELFRQYYGLATHDRVKRQRLVAKFNMKSYDNLQVNIFRLWQKVYSSMEDCLLQEGMSLSEVIKDKEGRKLVKDCIKSEIRL